MAGKELGSYPGQRQAAKGPVTGCPHRPARLWASEARFLQPRASSHQGQLNGAPLAADTQFPGHLCICVEVLTAAEQRGLHLVSFLQGSRGFWHTHCTYVSKTSQALAGDFQFSPLGGGPGGPQQYQCHALDAEARAAPPSPKAWLLWPRPARGTPGLSLAHLVLCLGLCQLSRSHL